MHGDAGVHRPLATPALYYPYADFQSEAWVKLALINWYRVERIKPVRYPHKDRPFTRRLFDSGWLQDITPRLPQLEAVADQFLAFLVEADDHIKVKYAVSERGGWPKAHFGTPPPGADQRLAYVYAGSSDDGLWNEGKVIPSLIETLERRGLVLPYKIDGAMWLGLHPNLAIVYMCALTSVIADHRQLVPITHDGTVHRAFGRSALEGIEEALTGGSETPRRSAMWEVESQYIEIALRGALHPVNLDEIRIESIIDFRGTHETELQTFQSHIFDLREEVLRICQISDAEEIRHRLGDLYKSRTEPELNDLQNKLHRFGIRSIPGFLEMRIDKETAIQTIGGAATMAGAHFVLGPAAPVAVPFAISVVAIPYIRRRRQELMRLEHESPASLLLAMKRKFANSKPEM